MENKFYLDQLANGEWIIVDRFGVQVDGPFKTRLDAINLKDELNSKHE